MPIKAADNNNNEKPINSIPMFNATNREYKIAVVTPVHSKILLFIIKCYQKALECTIIKLDTELDRFEINQMVYSRAFW